MVSLVYGNTSCVERPANKRRTFSCSSSLKAVASRKKQQLTRRRASTGVISKRQWPLPSESWLAGAAGTTAYVERADGERGGQAAVDSDVDSDAQEGWTPPRPYALPPADGGRVRSASCSEKCSAEALERARSYQFGMGKLRRGRTGDRRRIVKVRTGESGPHARWLCLLI